MMIPSEMPSVTMGENGHGNGNNDGVKIDDNDLDGNDPSDDDDHGDDDHGKEQALKGLSVLNVSTR